MAQAYTIPETASRKSAGYALIWLLLFCGFNACAGTGKIIATAGLLQIEGSGGGGVVPWATLTGYDSRSQTSATAYATRLSVDDFRLNSFGAALSFYDRVEISLARLNLDVKPLNTNIAQTVAGAKIRLYGDVVYSAWPQVSAGIQYKHLQDSHIASSLGVLHTSGTDWYLAATRVHLGMVAGYNLVWNATIRYTDANQLGLLGFGNQQGHNRKLVGEGSAAVLLSDHLAIGIEYRQRPDNLAIGESAIRDVFVTYIPSKLFNITMAWVDLGSVAGLDDQQGIYLSLGGQLW
ncbi:DUF3034 family protein [Salinimonas lutimaris]|uniref:DUF3034 family protein n=1 Tax=Salinimonas lutimaris TaxID=914153 RepID=UPI0010C05C1E|nr:DUF3034 family protein [Salinimonas lutimaris]